MKATYLAIGAVKAVNPPTQLLARELIRLHALLFQSLRFGFFLLRTREGGGENQRKKERKKERGYLLAVTVDEIVSVAGCLFVVGENVLQLLKREWRLLGLHSLNQRLELLL